MAEPEKFSLFSAIECHVDNGDDLGQWISLMKWQSFVNDGYMFYVRMIDPNLAMFAELTNQKVLADAKNKPLPVTFKIKYVGVEGNLETDTRKAYLVNLFALTPPGEIYSGSFQFIATDPPSWYLNKGDADGSAWDGNVSQVIKQVVQKYAPGIGVEVGDTDDNKKNVFWMMRQDPKTFIMTLLDWSSSVTKKQTNWVVASVDEKIIIKEQSELQSKDLGSYTIDDGSGNVNNAWNWKLLGDNFLANVQSALITSGISAVSGLYCSTDNDPTKKNTKIDDSNTENKKNVNITNTGSYSKPSDTEKGLTYIRAIPEDSAGLIGKKYQEYIDGRARGMFLGMLGISLRIKVTVWGAYKLHDSSNLGVSTVFLTLKDSSASGRPFDIINGKWMIYGWCHHYLNRQWTTDLYLVRLDYNSSAQKV